MKRFSVLFFPTSTMLTLGALLALGPLHGASVVLVNDQFSDENVSAQNTPTSLAWWGGDVDDVIYSAANGGQLLMQTSSASARQAVAHFKPQGQEVTLGIGESLALSFNFTPSGAVGTTGTGNLFRYGLFSTNGDAASYLTSSKSTASMEYTGYAASVHNSISSPNFPGASVRADIIVRDYLRNQTSSSDVNGGQLITNSSAYFTPYATATTNYPSASSPGHDPSAAGNPYSQDTSYAGTFTVNQTYLAELVLTRIDANSVLVTSTLSGGNWGGGTVVDRYLHVGQNFVEGTGLSAEGRATFSFDTIALAYNWNDGAGFQNMLVDNVLLVHTVPEPGRYLLAIGAMGALALRRSRRSLVRS